MARRTAAYRWRLSAVMAEAARPIPDTYYTVSQLACLWQCDPGVVYRLIRQGRLSAFKLGVGYRISSKAAAECEALLTAESARKNRRTNR